MSPVDYRYPAVQKFRRNCSNDSVSGINLFLRFAAEMQDCQQKLQETIFAKTCQ